MCIRDSYARGRLRHVERLRGLEQVDSRIAGRQNVGEHQGTTILMHGDTEAHLFAHLLADFLGNLYGHRTAHRLLDPRRCGLHIHPCQLILERRVVLNAGLHAVSYTHLDVYKRQVR